MDFYGTHLVTVNVNKNHSKNLKKNYKYILIVVFSTLAVILSGAVNWLFQVTVGLMIFLFSSFYLKQKLNKKSMIYFMILIIPFLTIYGYGIISTNQPFYSKLRVLPILIAPVIGLVFGYFIKFNLKSIFLCTLMSSLLGYILMPNWIAYTSDDENPISKPFPDLKLIDIKGNPFELPKNKTVVIDIWSSSCGVCIKEFPEFEELVNNYKDNKDVEFISLNLPLRRDKNKDIKKYVNKYKFKSIFAQNINSWEKLDNNTVPKILIVNPENVIIYKGSLYTKWYYFYNNIYNLIEKNAS